MRAPAGRWGKTAAGVPHPLLTVGPGCGLGAAGAHSRAMDPNEPPVKPDEPGKEAEPSIGRFERQPAKEGGELVPQPHGGALKRGGVARKKGVPNKATTNFRETVTKLLHANEKTIAKWVDQVANGVPAVYDKEGKLVTPGVPPNPLGGLKAIAALAEFAAPRLSRQETVGEGGGPVTVVVRKEG